MSRSYRKFPLFRDNLWGKSLKKGKQYSNRKIRRQLNRDIYLDVGNGKHYKSYGLDSWDLWEYKSYQTKEDAIDEWEKEQQEIENGIKTWKSKYNQTKEDAIRDWYISYKRK